MRFIKNLCLALALVYTAAPAIAAPRAAPPTNAQFASYCVNYILAETPNKKHTANVQLAQFCMGYLAAVKHMAARSEAFGCIPEKEPVLRFAEIYTQWVNDNPANGKDEAMEGVRSALSAAYACGLPPKKK